MLRISLRGVRARARSRRVRRLSWSALLSSAALALVAASAAATTPTPAVALTAATASPDAGAEQGPARAVVREVFVLRNVLNQNVIVPSDWKRTPAPLVSWGGAVPSVARAGWVLEMVYTFNGQPVYQVHSASNYHLCLDADSLAPDAFIYQRECAVNRREQLWTLRASGNRDFQIAPTLAPHLALTPQDLSRSAYLWLREADPSSRWYADRAR